MLRCHVAIQLVCHVDSLLGSCTRALWLASLQAEGNMAMEPSKTSLEAAKSAMSSLLLLGIHCMAPVMYCTAQILQPIAVPAALPGE